MRNKSSLGGTRPSSTINAQNSRQTGSNVSLDSIGFGTARRKPIRPNEPWQMPLLLAEGEIPPNNVTHDCIIYLIVCDQHDRMAIMNTAITRVVALPFVAIPMNSDWDQVAVDGLHLLLHKNESDCFISQTSKKTTSNYNVDVNNEGSKRMPKRHQMNLIHVLRLQLPSEEFQIRLFQLVNIKSTDKNVCCQNNKTLEWVSIKDMQNDMIKPLWGPEPKMMLNKLYNRDMKYIFEFSKDTVLSFLMRPEKLNALQAKLLAGCKVSSSICMSLYEDYVEHCFPSFSMTLESFRIYLIKYGYDRRDPRFESLFRAVAYNRRYYIDFFEFITGMVSLEPDTPDMYDARLRTVFRYFDHDLDNKLNAIEMEMVLREVQPATFSDERFRAQAEKICRSCVDGKVKLEDFIDAIRIGKLKGIDKVCRAPKKIIPLVVAAVKKRHDEQANVLLKKATETKNVRQNRGLCQRCRAQDYDYSVHCVTFDSNGRCTNPTRTINKATLEINVEQPINRDRYSIEYRFNSASMSNVFFELIRSRQTYSNPLLTKADEDALELATYIGKLCREISDLFDVEERLMKIQSPAIIVGDLLGNIIPMMTIDKVVLTTSPILQRNIVFLGNYIGRGEHNVEVLCYLFALKLMSPNMVLLLRGFNEDFKQAMGVLLQECKRKYSEMAGNMICNELIQTLERMPFGVVVDDSILCLHSGIPQQNDGRLTLLHDIPKPLHEIGKCPLAYEVVSRVPTETNDSRVTLFTRLQLKAFLQGNDLTHMIRGHDGSEMATDPTYRLNHEASCVTISSHTSNPIVVYLEPGKNLQIVKPSPKDVNIVPNRIILTQLWAEPAKKLSVKSTFEL